MRQTLRILERVRRVLRPPPDLDVDEWADENRRLSPEGSAEPGRWNTSRAEYQRGILKAINDPTVERVVVMSSAQVGKTEILLNAIGYYTDQDPAPILVVQPSLEMAQAFSKDRLAPMLRDTPRLVGVVSEAGSKKSGNTMLHKTFKGGQISISGANSASSLASRPIRILLADEVDRYPASAGTEGDPVSLAVKRTRTFWNRKIIIPSTPTIKGASRIETEYELSDQRRYYVPCPDCGHSQTLKWSHVQWPDGEPDKAMYCCEECASLWSDAKRLQQIRLGEWIAEGEFNGRAGFHLNEIYSPWSTMREMAVAFLEAKQSPETLQTFVNTALGETWDDDGDQVEGESLFSRRVKYDAPVPRGGLVLVCGVDVQDDRLEYEVIAYGEGEQNWGIENGEISGDPSLSTVWADLDAILGKTWEHESGHEMHIAAMGIDSGGHHTHIVYDYCYKRRNRRVFALKGIGGEGRPVVKMSRKQKGAKSRKNDLYMVGVDDAKGIIMSRLNITEPGPGYCHFPIEYTEEFFEQLTAEKRVTKYRKGFPVREWHKTRPRNEAFDNRVYAYAVLKILNPVYSVLSKAFETDIDSEGKAKTNEKEAEPAKSKPQRRRRSNYVKGWK